MSIQLDNTFCKADNIVTRKVMGETLLVPISGEIASMDALYTLNDTGDFIWQALNGTRSLAQISQELQEEYEASASVLETDLLELASALMDAGLIVAK